MSPAHAAGVDLFWLPLGAGGHFVAFNGRMYESVQARREHREPLNLYHTALGVTVPEGHFVVENSWPIPDGDGNRRGVAVDGPVGFDWLGRFRVFRYEIRRWRNGTIADIAEAVGGAQRISADIATASRILELVPGVPSLVWGRKPADEVEMWNSNSVISWLLTRAGVSMDSIHPPIGGRAPGWSSGIAVANQILSARPQPES